MEAGGGDVRLSIVGEAARDYKYLLSRGYPRTPSLSLVASKHRLTARERMLLYRCIHPSAEASAIRSKIIASERVAGRSIVVDGFNNIITVRAVLHREQVYVCDDGVLRDLSLMHGRIIIDEEFRRIIALILDTLRKLGADSITVFYDRQVSRSGELASYTRMMLTHLGLMGTALTSMRNDVAVMKSGQTVSTSDIVILLKARAVFDTPGYIARSHNARIINIASLINQEAKP